MSTRPYVVDKRTGRPAHPICYSELSPNQRRRFSRGDIDWNELAGEWCPYCGGPFSEAETKAWLDRLRPDAPR